MTRNPDGPVPILLVGVDEDQSPVVVSTAAALAAQLGATVVCLNVQSGRLITQRLPEPLDRPTGQVGFDDGDEPDNRFPEALDKHLTEVFSAAGVSWEAREVEGDPGKALARVAEELDATMIVVGTRRPGIRGRIEQLVDGSVAVHLAHRQSRPVLVVPQDPSQTGRLPW